MWNSAKGGDNTESRRAELLKKGYELFSTKSIEAISMRDVASAVGCGSASIYRYYSSKPEFVVAVATWKLEQFKDWNEKRRPKANFDGMTAAEIFEFYLDSFLMIYKNNKDFLRFNQFFNVYVQSEHIDTATLQPFQKMIEYLREQFSILYMKAQQDKTIRTDIPEQTIFSTTLHLMLAATTRYAVGLVYIPEVGFDAEEELKTLKRVILREYQC